MTKIGEDTLGSFGKICKKKTKSVTHSPTLPYRVGQLRAEKEMFAPPIPPVLVSGSVILSLKLQYFRLFHWREKYMNDDSICKIQIISDFE